MIELRISHNTRTDGPTLRRVACKAVIRRHGRLLLLRSTSLGAYKFPGGGCEPGESHTGTLTRELAAECGRRVHEVGSAVAEVIESHDAVEPGAVFEMTSIYYEVTVGGDTGERELEAYEVALGLEPCWVTAEKAIAANQAVLVRDRPHWVERETRVLEAIEARSTIGARERIEAFRQ